MKTLEDWIYLGLTHRYEPLGLEHGSDARLHQHNTPIISILDSRVSGKPRSQWSSRDISSATALVSAYSK